MRRVALQDFGSALRRARKRCGLTQEALAERADLHENYVSRLETGDQEPGLLVILRLSRALGLVPGVLLEEFSISRLRKLRLK